MNTAITQVGSEVREVELRQLEYFIAVAEQLNFSRAAEQLYVSQPLLSQQIAELEQEFGTALFIRNRRSVRLTDAGLALLQEARGILERVNTAKRVVLDAANGLGTEGKLKIGYEQVFDRSLITSGTFRFRRNYPHVDCSLSALNYAKLIYSVSEGELDIGFTLLPNERLGANLNVMTLGADTLSLIVAEPLGTDDFGPGFVRQMVETYPIYAIEHDSKGINSMIKVLTALQLTPQFVFVETVTDILINVEAGAGIAFLPYRRVSAQKESGIAIFPLVGYNDAAIELAAVWNSAVVNPFARLFLKEIEQTVGLRTGNSSVQDAAEQPAQPRIAAAAASESK